MSAVTRRLVCECGRSMDLRNGQFDARFFFKDDYCGSCGMCWANADMELGRWVFTGTWWNPLTWGNYRWELIREMWRS